MSLQRSILPAICHAVDQTFNKKVFQKKKIDVSFLEWEGRGGSRAGAVVRALASHQCGLCSIPRSGVVCGLSLLVVYCAPRGFSPGLTPVFPSPQKPTFELIYVNLIDLICVASHKLFTARRWLSWLNTGLPCGRS